MSTHEITAMPVAKQQLINRASDLSLGLQRIASYKTWTSESISTVQLARAGLTYTGYNDTMICNCCKTELSGWQQGDDPFNKHKTQAPDCSFEADCSLNIDSIAHSLESLIGTPVTSGNTKDSADCIPVVSSTSTACKTLNPEFRETCRQVIRRALTGTSLSSNILTPAANPQETEDPVIDRDNPDFELLRSERIRLLTYNDWPETAGRIVDKHQLAQTGLFFTGQADRVQCVFCRGYLRNWVQGDQPAQEHRRHFPDCPFIRGQQVGNVLDCVDNPRNQLNQTPSQYVPSVRESAAPPTPVQLPRPRHPNFITLESRIQSFQGKRVPDGQQPKQLALAGFFYVGPQDNVRCFQCDGGLKNWQPTDIAWTEHQRWFPRCPYVLLHPNGPAADNSTAMMLVESAILNNEVRQRDSPDNDNFTDRVQYRVEPREVKARMDTPFVKTVLDQGHPRELVRQAIEKRLTTTGDDFLSVASLLEAIFNIEEQQAGLVALQNNNSTRSAVDVSATQQFLNASAASATVSIDSPQRTQHADELKKKKKKQKVNSANNGDEKDYVHDEEEKLEEENRQLKESRTCKVCMDKEVNTVFLPCGHLVCCDPCAKSLPNCPICRAFIKGTVKTFLS